MENKLGSESAYPFFTWNIPGYGNCVTIQDKDGNMNHLEYTPGISKRFYAACAAIQGLLAYNKSEDYTNKELVEEAYIVADEILKQELD